MSQTHNVSFKISSELKNIIGRDLITDDFVAIFELVKNSFDADAKTVHLVFDFDTEPQSLYVIDDGCGMSESDLREKWLFVAYSAKKEEENPQRKQRYAGNKGVGRFSCDRLGCFLEIQTKTKTEKNVNTLFIDWNAFENKAQTEFKDVTFKQGTTPRFSPLPNPITPPENGTVIKITGLRTPQVWVRTYLLELKRALSKLIDPFNNFLPAKKILIHCDRDQIKDDDEITRKGSEAAQIVNGAVDNPIFQLLKNRTTILSAKILCNKLQMTLVDRGMLICTTEQPIDSEFLLLRDVNLDIEIAALNRAAKVFFSRRMGLQPVKYGSLFLIHNGFRVYPVGEASDDYWKINHRKQQGYARFLGPRDILGCVHLSTDDPELFKESSSRDKGLIETPAVLQLKDCVLECIKRLEAYVTNVIWTDVLDKDEETPGRLSLDFNRARIISLVQKLSQSPKVKVVEYNKDLISILHKKSAEYEPALANLRVIARENDDWKLLNEIDAAEKKLAIVKKELEEAQKIAQQEQEARRRAEENQRTAERERQEAQAQKVALEREYQEEQKRNLFLVAQSTKDTELLECFLHQITIYAGEAQVALKYLLKKSAKKALTQDQMVEAISHQLELLQNIFFAARFATSANFRLDSEKTTADLTLFTEEYIEKIAGAYNPRIQCRTIRHCESFVLTFNPIEFGVVLDNLISNAKKAGASKLQIDMAIKDNVLELTCSDNGTGLPALPQKERIFEKGFSRTEGAGLGLYYCKQIVEKWHGSLSITDPQPERGSSLTIRIVKK